LILPSYCPIDVVTIFPAMVDGPIREYYLVGLHDTADETLWRTQIGWPIFRADSPVADA